MADFRTIVNYALRESGITQDDLTTGNFASPPDPILTRFKYWVAQAYEDIQTDRRDWEFMQATGVTLCSPKMEVYGMLSSGGSIDDFTNATMSLNDGSSTSILTISSAEQISAAPTSVTLGTAEGNLYVSYLAKATPEPGDQLLNSASVPWSNTVTCFFHRHGRYDLSQAVAAGRNASADIAELKLDSLVATDVLALSGSTNSYTKLQFVPYGDWLRYAYDRPTHAGKPLYFTVSNDGRVEFFPPLDTTYNISFEYTRTPQTLSLHGDTPTYLPARFHNAIAWRAVMYWAEYEGNGQQYNRAKARYSKFETEMIRDLLPPVKVSYDARQW